MAYAREQMHEWIAQLNAAADAYYGGRGEWMTRYIHRVAPGLTHLDYMMLSHWHHDHSGSPKLRSVAAKDGRRAAGVGVAMANACPEVPTAADYTTLSNDEDGVAAAMRHFGIAS